MKFHKKGAFMRIPVKQAGTASLRAARPTPSYNDRVSEEYISQLNAYVAAKNGGPVELTPISGDAW
ncbi:uncharacterized protein YecE (DUF72 family) [Sphingomonas sp. UYP23]